VPPIFSEDIVKEGHKVNHVQLELNLSGNLFILGKIFETASHCPGSI
jgi:hypothetical protein